MKTISMVLMILLSTHSYAQINTESYQITFKNISNHINTDEKLLWQADVNPDLVFEISLCYKDKITKNTLGFLSSSGYLCENILTTAPITVKANAKTKQIVKTVLTYQHIDEAKKSIYSSLKSVGASGLGGDLDEYIFVIKGQEYDGYFTKNEEHSLPLRIYHFNMKRDLGDAKLQGDIEADVIIRKF